MSVSFESLANLKADDYMNKALKITKKWSLFSSYNKYEEAAEYYKKAATQYKIANEKVKSGEAYLKAAVNSEKANNLYEACSLRHEAGSALKEINPKETERLYTISIHMHMEENRFSQAARINKELAEMHEKTNNYEKALKYYKKSANCYKMANMNTSGNQSLLKAAYFNTLLKNYNEAYEIYEKVAVDSIENDLLKYLAKNYYFNALICLLIECSITKNIEKVKEKLDKYSNSFYEFKDSDENNLLQNLLDDYENGDMDKFSKHIYDYDETKKLEDWKITILLKVKNSMNRPEPTKEVDYS